MKRIYATEDVLASILILDRNLEIYPEPYRSNGETEIVVSFDAYTKFITKYLDTTNYLATDTVKLLYYARCGVDEALCQCFYKDIAMAISKELWYTDISRRPTNITHIVEGATEFGLEYVDAIYVGYKRQIVNAQQILLKELASKGYSLNPNKLVNFQAEFRYASTLFAMSSGMIPFVEWSLERSIL